MKKQLYPLLLGIAIAGSCHPLAAQVVRGGNGSQSALAPLTLNKQTVRQLRTPNTQLRADFTNSRNHYFVLGFASALTPEAEMIVARHAQFLSYVHDNMHILTTTTPIHQAIAAIKRELNGLVNVTAEGALPAHYKLSKPLYDCLKNDGELSPEIRQAGVIFSTFAPEDRQALERTLKRWKIPYQLTPYEQVKLLNTNQQVVQQLAALPYVNFVSVNEPLVILSFNTSAMMQTNRISILNYDHNGPTGRGVTFANWETYGAQAQYPINTFGRNLSTTKEGRKLSDASPNEHGTQCALIATGADNIEENLNRGMAPGMNIIAMNDKVAPWGKHHNGVLSAIQQGYSPLVSNHSIGVLNLNPPNQYNDAAATIDRAAYQTNAYICCYPTGNAAYGATKYDSYKDYDYGRISGDMKTNKNGFAVHAVNYPGVDITWANFGPTIDGRMKPEVCAQSAAGTSFSSPGVAGLAGVLLEQCKTSLGVHRSDIVKAVIINTALDVRTYANEGKEEGFGLDYRTGYGEIHPLAAARSISEHRVDYGKKLAKGETAEHKIIVPAGQTELNVTLYWNDPAASAGTKKALVNDLDLEVIDPTGKVILPWTLDPSPANVTKPAKRAINTRDNHERVRITAEKANQTITPGEYTIRVKGTSIPRGTQEFATTWQWKARGIEWTAFPEGYRLAPGETILLSWDMTVSDEEDRNATNFKEGTMTPQVYYRTTPITSGQEDPTSTGSGWTRCAPLDDTQYWYNDMKGGQKTTWGKIYGKNFLKWAVPAQLPNTSHLQFMVVAGSNGSHPLRVISPKAQVCEQPTLRPEILLLSENKVKLSWQPATSIKQGKYLIYALYDKYMTKVGETTIDNTTAEITAPAGVKWNQNQLFAIAYYDAQTGAKSKRSLPIGLDPYNPEMTDANKMWATSYLLCPGDVLNFSTNRLEGNIQWYKNDKPLEGEKGTSNTIPLTMEDTGKYHYTTSYDGHLVYTSPSFKITAGNIKREDIEQWGDYTWAGFVMGKNASNTLPQLTSTTPYHGHFSLNKFSFDSNVDLFEAGKDTPTQIQGYTGCPSDNTKTSWIVMKRRGFIPGSYTLKFTKTSGSTKAIITDANGNKIVKENPTNKMGYDIGTFELNDKSTLELHWMGDCCAFEATYRAADADLALRPGRADNLVPNFWLNPNRLSGEDGSQVKRLFDGYPQAEVYNLTTTTGALLNKTGSNYNPALVFSGKSSYTGGIRTPNTGTAATDFVVVAPKSKSGNSRIVSFGNGDYDSETASSYTIVADNSNRFATIRNNNALAHAYNKSHIALFTVARSDKELTIDYNGKKMGNKGRGISDPLDLQKISIGGSFNNSTPDFFDGTLAEVIHYDTSLSDEEAQRIRTYLAIKHGITLNHDYVGTQGTLLPVSPKHKYRYQITALGREDRSLLNQKQSRGHVLNGYPAQMILTLGDLAKNNEENTASFTADGSYYIMAASSNEAPHKAEGNVSNVHFLLRTTLPQHVKADSISFVFPRKPYLREKTKAFIELSDKDFSNNEVNEQNTLIPLQDYHLANSHYLRAKYLPTAGDIYFRVVWKADNTLGITHLVVDADQIHYDAHTHSVSIAAHDVQQLDVVDLSGRQLAVGIPVIQGKAQLPSLQAGTYLLTLRNAAGATATVKINIQ